MDKISHNDHNLSALVTFVYILDGHLPAYANNEINSLKKIRNLYVIIICRGG